ncbi:MAG TPA: alpha/beta hydrolase [Vicinamibacterales bacterium]|nr:alpha/beta hydrolase [Vicinamibacterales bacterium]
MRFHRSARSALIVLAAALAAGPSMPAFAQEAAKPPAGSTIVLVHGAWGGGWAFRRVEALLRERGHRVYRPTLTGQGERVHLASPGIGLETHIQDVVNVILFEDLRDIVLVGHSYGGMVVTGVADRVADRVRKLVYVDAFVPGDGDSLMSLLGRDRAAWMQSMVKDGFVIPPWVKPGQAPPHDVPHPFKTLTDTLSLENEAARQIPATYILTIEAGRESDDFSPQAERARERGWRVEQLQADHNPQWSAPEQLVDMLDRAACPCGD